MAHGFDPQRIVRQDQDRAGVCDRLTCLIEAGPVTVNACAMWLRHFDVLFGGAAVPPETDDARCLRGRVNYRKQHHHVRGN
jgi:hypothetical protein